jgi:hypothetical protein
VRRHPEDPDPATVRRTVGANVGEIQIQCHQDAFGVVSGSVDFTVDGPGQLFVDDGVGIMAGRE